MPAVEAISYNLLNHLREQYLLSIKEMVHEKNYSKGINYFTERAIPAYIIAVNIVEAFMGETFFGSSPEKFEIISPNTGSFWDALDKAELSEKLLFMPELVFKCSFIKGEAPYQDMHLLIKLRNALVHYKMKLNASNVNKILGDLQQRKIAIVGTVDTPWTTSISTTEGIRWAHNTVCETIEKIISFDTQGIFAPTQIQRMRRIFFPISNDYAIGLIKQYQEESS